MSSKEFDQSPRVGPLPRVGPSDTPGPLGNDVDALEGEPGITVHVEGSVNKDKVEEVVRHTLKQNRSGKPSIPRESGIPRESAFHEDNISRSSLIMLVRIYEAQMAVLNALDPEAYYLLNQDHENGDFNSPPPRFVE